MARETQPTELAIIREKRSWHTRLLVKLFPRSFNSFMWSHLARAHEKGEIGNDTFHRLAHYCGADCRLGGYGETGKSI